jgi:hypothetical protein
MSAPIGTWIPTATPIDFAFPTNTPPGRPDPYGRKAMGTGVPASTHLTWDGPPGWAKSLPPKICSESATLALAPYGKMCQ